MTKLYYHPEKLNDILNGNNDTFPVQVELSLTSRCNSNCRWCHDKGLRKKYSGDMKKDVIIERLQEMKSKGLKGIVLEGGGEPTLHKDFVDIVTVIKDDIGLDVGLITNGVNIPYLDIVNKFSWIRVSLDASTREEYFKLKKHNKFDQVIDNLCKISQTEMSVKLGVHYIITKENCDAKNIINLVSFLKNNSIDYIQFTDVKEDREIFVSMESLPDLHKIKKKYETKRFQINLDSFYPDYGNFGLSCYAHSYAVKIAPSGEVLFCCRLRVNVENSIGNIIGQTFDKIWNGTKRRLLKGKVLDGQFCEEYCPSCRISKYNKIIHELLKKKNMVDKNFV